MNQEKSKVLMFGLVIKVILGPAHYMYMYVQQAIFEIFV